MSAFIVGTTAMWISNLVRCDRDITMIGAFPALHTYSKIDAFQPNYMPFIDTNRANNMSK
jgi:hypothetical protein